MLPGFRFLFAAIVLSMSILVFGLGAAALLRAAHEEFASNPTWRAAPEPVFAQQSEATKATLAMMRVDPPLPEPKPPVSATAFAPNEPARAPSPEAEKAATPAPDASPTETSADTPPAPDPAEAPSTKVATAEDATPGNSEPAPAAKSDAPVAAASETTTAAMTETSPAPTTSPQATDSAAVAKKLASVGDTAKTDGSEQTTTADPKAEEKARLRAQRAKERRRLAAQRARLARQQQASAVTPQFDLQQQATNPFALPTLMTPPARIKRAAQTDAARTP